MVAASATRARRLGRAGRTAADASGSLATSATSISAAQPAAQSIFGAVVHDRWNCGFLFGRLLWPDSGNYRTRPRAGSPFEDQEFSSRIRRKTVCDCGCNHRQHKRFRRAADFDLDLAIYRAWVTVSGSLESILR